MDCLLREAQHTLRGQRLHILVHSATVPQLCALIQPPFPQNKKYDYQSNRTKTQTPIVAKLTQCENGCKAHNYLERNLRFYQIRLLVYGKIGVLSLKENTPNFTSIKLV